jgi:glycosyltransferase involved in cell wall biosynthesis
MKITVIMAVYNAVTTVERMVCSLLSQTFADFEIVAVDDGSTDGSGDLLDRMAAEDGRIRVIHQANAGVSAARQTGLDNARGVYVIHADADDWVEPNMLEGLLATAIAEDADIVICDYFTDVVGKPTKRIVQRPDSLEASEVLYSLYAKGLFGGLCHKLIKKSVYDRSAIRFTPGVNYCEDLLVLTRMLTSTSYTPKIAYHDGAYYHYVVNRASLTRSVSKNGYKSICKFHRLVAELLPRDERFKRVVDGFPLNEFRCIFENRLYENRKQVFALYKTVKYQTKNENIGLRWKMCYFCIQCGFLAIAHKFVEN